MAVANREDDVEEIRRAFEEGLREAKAGAKPTEARVEEAKATEKPATVTTTKTVEEKPREAQARAQGDEYIKDVVNRASVIFGLRERAEDVLYYAYSLHFSRDGSQWLHNLPKEDDLDALALMLSVSYGLRNVVGFDQATVFAEYLLKKMHIVYNPYIDTLQCYNPETGVYEPHGPSDECVEKIRSIIRSIVNKIGYVTYIKKKRTYKEELKNLPTPQFYNKLFTKLEDEGLNRFNTLKRSRRMIALPNKVYLDLGDDFVKNGEVKVIEASPDYYIDVLINTPIDIALLKELAPKVPVPKENEDWETYKERYLNFMVEAFNNHAKDLYKEFKKWVNTDEYAILLLELIGFVMYPEYPIRAIFILLGGGNDPAKSGGNGKSTFLDLLIHIVGKRNVVGIDFQKLTENRFMASQLYGKLANIVGDMSTRAINDTSLLKALSGGDEITADVKYKNPITFRNRAKLIASMNEMPFLNDQTKAIKDRLHIIPFPNVFPENPKYREELLNKPDLKKVATLGLVALRAVLYRGRFITKGEVDVFSTTVDPVGEFLKQLETTGFDGCRAERIDDAKTPREKLYALFVKWKEKNKVTRPVPKQTFTAQLGRWGIGVTRDSRDKHYYIGIKLICEDNKTNEQSNGVSESNDSNEQ